VRRGDLMLFGRARSLLAEDYSAFVAYLPKDTLLHGARAAGFGKVRTSWSKMVLIDYFRSPDPFDLAMTHYPATVSLRSTTSG
jgi:hypothetical protein